jgi:hypothetical protein
MDTTAINLASIDQLLGDIAAKAGRPRHCCEISFGRIDSTSELTISIVVHLGKLSGISNRRVNQRAHGCGVTVEEAVEEVLTDIERFGLLSEHEVAKRRARRAAQPVTVQEVPQHLQAAFTAVSATGDLETLARVLQEDTHLEWACARAEANGGSFADYVDLAVWLRKRDGKLKPHK